MQEKVTHLELMKALLDRGANPNARLTRKLWYRPTDHDQAWTGTVGTTPFWRAAASNDLAAMKMLVAAGADPLIPSNEDVTPMMAAAGIGWSAGTTKNVPGSWLPAIEYCLQFGGDVNDADVFGYTPLHGAAYRGDNEVVKFLVAKGAKVNVTSSTAGGEYLQTSTTAGSADASATVDPGTFGQVTGTGTTPSAFLGSFGGTTTGPGSTLPWFIVTDPAYGAVGDGTTDDTAAINLAIAALNAAGGGVLYFPAGNYKCTSALTPITPASLILGDGHGYAEVEAPIAPERLKHKHLALARPS